VPLATQRGRETNVPVSHGARDGIRALSSNPLVQKINRGAERVRERGQSGVQERSESFKNHCQCRVVQQVRGSSSCEGKGDKALGVKQGAWPPMPRGTMTAQ